MAKNIFGIMSGSNTDISSGKSFTVAAGESISLFAQKSGIKLFVGKGKVDIQAQGDELSALAKNDITVTSTESTVTITAARELTLTCGGGYIKLSDGNIEIADPQNILFKSTNWQQMGPASLNKLFPRFPSADTEMPSEVGPNTRTTWRSAKTRYIQSGNRANSGTFA